MNSSKKTFWRRIVDCLSSFVLWICRINIIPSGFEKLNQIDNFLLVSNHISMFDPIALLHLMKKWNPLFVSKPENFNIPIAGSLMKKSGFLPIDRENPRNAIKTIYEAADRVKEGSPMVIYPEGTRNKTPQNGLLPFHNGVFKIAKRAGVPVAVLVMTGTDQVKGNAPWRRTNVTVTVVDILDQGFVSENNDRTIGDRAHRIMEEYLNNQTISERETA